VKAPEQPQSSDFGGAMAAWAAREPTVSGLVLIGSRQRDPGDAVWRADAQSDWDFQIISSEPRMFAGPKWTCGLGAFPLQAYASRVARIGGVPKINALFAGAEADFVVIPSRLLRRARLLTALGRHHRPGWTRAVLQDVAVVVRPGWRFLKDTGGWDKFYRRAVAAVSDPRMTDALARQLAAAFVCDYVWTLRKLDRGELLAAQRMFHRELVETNFRLLHELKLRRGERTFPEARRLERVAAPAEQASVTADARLEPASLFAAVERSAVTCRVLMAALVGEAWRWPL
jgi:hypothetical protein